MAVSSVFLMSKRFALLLACLSLSINVCAAEFESGQRDRITERPNARSGPTEVNVGVLVIDLDKIDDVEQRYSVDRFVRVGWQDERLALPDDMRSGRIRTFSRDEVWTSRALVMNDRGLSNQLPNTVDVDVAGNVVLRQRLAGDLAADLQFEQFPFDTATNDRHRCVPVFA